jgi:hypothetical protein
MSTSYRIGPDTVTAGDPRLDGLLASAHAARLRPLCLCRREGVPMYVAKVSGRFYMKRFPDTGGSHSTSCESYEPPQELSGLGQVSGSAIVENPDEGTTVLKFDFSLSKSGSRVAPAKGDGNADSVKTDGNKLTLRGTLHYLWEEAGFHKWSPSMTGKRTWSVLKRYLMEAAEDKTAKSTALADLLFIPDPFSSEKKDQLTQQRNARLRRVAAPENGARKLMIVVGEVKEIGVARFGHKVTIKHLPDFPFMLNDDIHKRLRKRFENELALWEALETSHLVAIGTFSVGQTGVASIEEMALMIVTENWIPFENLTEKSLLDKLTSEGRRFFKGLRYNLADNRPLASAVLSDTPEPVAMYVLPPAAGEDYLKALAELTEGSKLKSWQWDAESDMPAIPPSGAPA